MTARFLNARDLASRDPLIRTRCPVCAAHLRADADGWQCASGDRHEFPVVAGIPVLLNPQRSIFRVEDFGPGARTTFKEPSPLAVKIGRLLPSPSRDLSMRPCYQRLARALDQRPADRRRVLVIGCGDGSAGYGPVLGVEGVSLLETDVSMAGRATLVCDATDLPFEDRQFDLVVCVAVLEHVLEPQRCVDEIHRVLRDDGLVYATTPFMQQVHMGEYDFTRFTRSGHRWLFRAFDEVDSGIATGPASVLIWSVEYFFLAWTRSVALRRAIKGAVRLLLGWITVLDGPLARRASANDAAGGFYFLGQRAPAASVTAREMVAYYRGADAAK